jgi:hypothetical protein
MNCSAVKRKIPLFAGDDLSSAERGRVERHLEGCPRCRAEADGFRVFRQWISAAVAPGEVGQPVQRAREKAIRRVFLEERPKRSVWTIRRPAFSAVAAALLTVVLVGLLASMGDFRNRKTVGVAPGSDIQEVQVITVPTKDGVMLTWNNGEHAGHIVLRSSSPRNFDDSDAIPVCGDRYVERRGDGERVTYYKVFRTTKGCS